MSQKKELKEWRESRKMDKRNDSSLLKISALETKMQEVMNQNKMLQESICASTQKPEDRRKKGPLDNPLGQRGSREE